MKAFAALLGILAVCQTTEASDSALPIRVLTYTGFCPDGVYGVMHWPGARRPDGLWIWGSFCGKNNDDKGRFESQPFIAPAALQLFLAGYAGLPDRRLILKNVKSGEERELTPPSQPGEEWQYQVLPVPPEWAGKQVQFIAEDQATGPRGWLGFTLPVVPASSLDVPGVNTNRPRHGSPPDRIYDAMAWVILAASVIAGLVLTAHYRRKWLIIGFVWVFAGVAVLPAIFHWPAAQPYTGAVAYVPVIAGYLIAFAICYAIYHTELQRLSRSRSFVLVFLTYLLTTITNNLHGFSVDHGASIFPNLPNWAWQKNMHEDILQLAPALVPHSYRFLPNAIVRWMELGHMDFEPARDLYRLITGLLLFYCMYRYARLYCSYTGALIAMLLVAVIYPVSFEHYAGQFTDPLSHLSFVLALLFLEAEEFALLLTTLIIGSLAKETVLAMAGYYVLFCGKEKHYALKAGLLSIASIGFYFAVRALVLHGAMHYQQASGVGLDHVAENWKDTLWHTPFLLTAGALLPFLVINWKHTPGPLKRQALFLLPVLFTSGLFFSWLREARNFMPVVFVLAVVAGFYFSPPSTETFNQPLVEQATVTRE